jgi:SAM-dependent methyltransferase
MTVDGRDTATYWEVRARPYLGTAEEWQSVSGTGLPPWVGRFIHRLEERGVRTLARSLPGGRVLDVGCGYGRWLPITGRGRTVIAMDFSPSLVARAHQQRHGAPVMVADARRLPVQGAAVEAVYTVKVLQCLPQHERPAAVRELFAAVPVGGVVALLEKTSGEDGSPPDRWTRWAAEAGGTIVSWTGNQYVPLDRLLNTIVRRARSLIGRVGSVEPAGAARGAQPVRTGSPRLFATYMAVRGLLLGVSLLLEPVIERACSPRLAEHGIFVFRKA